MITEKPKNDSFFFWLESFELFAKCHGQLLLRILIFLAHFPVNFFVATEQMAWNHSAQIQWYSRLVCTTNIEISFNLPAFCSRIPRNFKVYIRRRRVISKVLCHFTVRSNADQRLERLSRQLRFDNSFQRLAAFTSCVFFYWQHLNHHMICS